MQPGIRHLAMKEMPLGAQTHKICLNTLQDLWKPTMPENAKWGTCQNWAWVLAAKHVATPTSVQREMDARARHAGGSQPTLLLTWHAGAVGPLCCGLQERLNTCRPSQQGTYSHRRLLYGDCRQLSVHRAVVERHDRLCGACKTILWHRCIPLGTLP